MTIFAALLAVTIAFPKEGVVLPPIEKCYVIGAADGVTNVIVNGTSVPVYRTGAWTAMIDVHAGVNTVRVDAVERVFRVEKGKSPLAAVKDAVGGKVKTYEKLKYAADEAKPHPKDKPAGAVTVVLDPGHGGAKDLGAISPHGWHEKDLNLQLALDVRDALVKLGYRVVMTREDDRPVELYDRPKTAHGEKADAFISIHHNAPPANRDAGALRYACVYSWNGIGAALAEKMAARMKAACGDELPNNGALHANFAVTRNPEIPSVLVEADFITHPAGEESVCNPASRHRLAAALAAGFADWCCGR